MVNRMFDGKSENRSGLPVVGTRSKADQKLSSFSRTTYQLRSLECEHTIKQTQEKRGLTRCDRGRKSFFFGFPAEWLLKFSPMPKIRYKISDFLKGFTWIFQSASLKVPSPKRRCIYTRNTLFFPFLYVSVSAL